MWVGGANGVGSERVVNGVGDLRDGDHACCVYRDEGERLSSLVPYFSEGRKNGYKLLYIADKFTIEATLRQIAAHGLTGSERPSVLQHDRSGSEVPVYEEPGILNRLEEETMQALAGGYRGLRTASDLGQRRMTAPQAVQQLDYEDRLEVFLRGKRCGSLCQCHKEALDPFTMLELISKHKFVIAGDSVYENFCRLWDNGGATDIVDSWLARLKLLSAEPRARAEFARRAERVGVAREIHDELGQILAGLKLELAALENRIRERQAMGSDISERLEEMRKLIDQSICETRKIAAGGTGETTITETTLAGLIESMAKEHARRSGIDFGVKAELGGRRLESSVAQTVFRVAQEAVTNAVRHADASKIDVVLEVDGRWMMLVVADNGKGMDQSRLAAGRTMGVAGMRERAESHGGSFELEGFPGVGTRVVLRLPIKEEHEA